MSDGAAAARRYRCAGRVSALDVFGLLARREGGF